jgi:hypothetical protein
MSPYEIALLGASTRTADGLHYPIPGRETDIRTDIHEIMFITTRLM